MSSLKHYTLWEDNSKISVSLPLTSSLRVYHELGSSFPLLYDPCIEKKAIIIGMFVLRPSIEDWLQPILNENGVPSSMFSLFCGWAFNFSGLDGGWLISNRNCFDAFRLALQYGCSDAVIIGAGTVFSEGIDAESVDEQGNKYSRKGYLWQPYTPTEWDHLKELDPILLLKILEQRLLWQNMGYLSDRRYPAQIIIAPSGVRPRSGSSKSNKTILDARIFYDVHPDGSPIEVLIVSSTNGCRSFKEALDAKGLRESDHLKLIDLSPQNDKDAIDLTELPSLLYQSYHMKIVNHDGGLQTILAFCKSKIVSQLNLTLCRKRSLYSVIESSPIISAKQREEALASFHPRVQYFFDAFLPPPPPPTAETAPSSSSIPLETSTPLPPQVQTQDPSTCLPPLTTTALSLPVIYTKPQSPFTQEEGGPGSPHAAIPGTFEPVSVIADEAEDAVVVVFDIRKHFNVDILSKVL